MYVNISYESGEPIYEQIKTQIRGQIIGGKLKEGEMLPSIRTLAKELKIGIITAKRAYDDLCAEGFLYSVQGKGVFVSGVGKSLAGDFALAQLRNKIEGVLRFAELNCVDKNTLIRLFNEIMEEENGRT